MSDLLCSAFPEILGAAVGAILTAGGAFGIYVVTQTLTRGRERQVRHYNALCRMNRTLNSSLDAMFLNVVRISGFRKAIEKEGVSHSFPRSVLIDEQPYEQLLAVEAINELLTINGDLIRMNSDIEELSRAYSQMVEALLAGRLSKSNYVAAASGVQDGLDLISKFSRALDGRIKRLLARVRLLARTDDPSAKSLWWKTATHPPSETEIAAEVQKLEAEIRKNFEADLRERGLA